MQVLVGEGDITTRVMVETMLRERGHTVRNCEDGFEAAKILSARDHPRVAILSNRLGRLRGLDVSRFLCATGKKSGVYLILTSETVDMELLELCRRAGVDDLVEQEIGSASLAARLGVAEKVVELEEELSRVQGVLKNLASFETPLQKKARALQMANAALLGVKQERDAGAEQSAAEASQGAAGSGVASQPAAAASATAASRAQGGRAAAGAHASTKHEKVFRGFQIGPDREEGEKAASSASASNGAVKSLLGDGEGAAAQDTSFTSGSSTQGKKSYESAQAAPSQDDYSNGSGDGNEHHDVLAEAEMIQNEELADEEIIHPFEFDEIILNVFSGMGVTLKSEIPPKPLPADQPAFVSWVGVAMPKEPVWMDVVLMGTEEAARAVTRELLGQSKVSDSDVCEMFAELQNMVQGSLRRYLEDNRKQSVLQLAIPKASHRDVLPEFPQDGILVDSGFSIEGEPLMAVLYEHRECVEVATLDEVGDYNLVCDPVKAEGKEDDLLVQGAVIRDREKSIIEGVKSAVSPFRAMPVSPLVNALGPESLF